MPQDIKAAIAEATRALLLDRHVKKLTVKEIVEQCHITRQTFYYHFEDIPALFRWMIERDEDKVLQQLLAQGDLEAGLRSFFVMAIHLMPSIHRGLDSNYAPELEQLLHQYARKFLAKAAAQLNLRLNCTPEEFGIILRYHSNAILGLLREWTEEDTEHLDEIVHTITGLLLKGLPLMDTPE